MPSCRPLSTPNPISTPPSKRSAKPTRAYRLACQSGPAAAPRRADGFAGLAAIIVAQQLSTASANAIWGRLAAAFEPLEPAVIFRARPAKLARLGLSAPKIRALKAIAKAVEREELPLHRLAALEAEDAHNADA